jgi:2-polyprenyl-3-methyl-5-hydroxy-6-metoxy-1,4-benzoquinol methylase
MPMHRSCPICLTSQFEPLPVFKRGATGLQPVVCRSCGLSMINPMYSYAEDNEWCPSARDMHRSVRSHRSINSAHRREMHKAGLCMEMLRKITKGGDEVLEIGAGDGSLVKLLKDYGAKPSGNDMDAESCRWLEKSFDIPTFAGPFEAVDFKGKKFDVIASSHFIEHVFEPVEVMRKIQGLLKPGGRVFHETPNVFRPKIGPRRLWSRPHKYYFSPRTLSLVLYEAGLRVTAIREFNRFAFQITAVKAEGSDLGPRPVGDRWQDVLAAINRHSVSYYATLQFLWRKMPVLKRRMIYRIHHDVTGASAAEWLSKAA